MLKPMEYVKIILCSDKSPLSKLGQLLNYGASECSCCSFWRGVFVGIVGTILVNFII